MKLIDKIRTNALLIIGLFLPYLMIIIFVAIIILFPYGTTEQKWENAGVLGMLVPLVSSLLGAILIAIYTMRRNKATSNKWVRINSFFLGFLFSSAFHYFVTIYFFMQLVYFYAGARH